MKKSKYKEAKNILNKGLNVVNNNSFLSKIKYEIGYIDFQYLDYDIKKNFLLESYNSKGFNNIEQSLIYPPFLLKSKINFDLSLIKNIYLYEKQNSSTLFNYHGHKNTYQSNHNIHTNDNFSIFFKNLNEVINNIILNQFNEKNYKIKITNMWFVITRKLGFIKEHRHLADLSGVIYIKTPPEKKNGNLKINNPKKNLRIIKLETENHKINILNTNKEIQTNDYIFEPEDKDLIIFNSYLNHSVTNLGNINCERIAIAWDGNFEKYN